MSKTEINSSETEVKKQKTASYDNRELTVSANVRR